MPFSFHALILVQDFKKVNNAISEKGSKMLFWGQKLTQNDQKVILFTDRKVVQFSMHPFAQKLKQIQGTILEVTTGLKCDVKHFVNDTSL